jgi:hypothetical protein
MKERTQLAYVWFAGHFLHLLLQQLFENVHIREADVAIVSSFSHFLFLFFYVCFLILTNITATAQESNCWQESCLRTDF